MHLAKHLAFAFSASLLVALLLASATNADEPESPDQPAHSVPELDTGADQQTPYQTMAELGAPRTPEVKGLPPKRSKRQILIVKSYTLLAANWKQDKDTPNADSQSVVLLRGVPSPSSHKNLKQAYVHFYPDDTKKLRPPTFDAKRGQIRLHMHQRQLQMVLAQLREKQRYCWIGHFPNGHIYADIHAGP